MDRLVGLVSNIKDNFAFIKEDNKYYFFHRKDVKEYEWNSILTYKKSNQLRWVRFTPTETPKGLRAIDIEF